MKKLILSLLLSALMGLSASAQAVSCHFGIGGGATINSFKEWKPQTGWQAGASMLLRLPMYFSLQPSVMFSQSYGMAPVQEASVVQDHRIRQNQLNIPLALQWGPDLGIIRPFLQIVPFVDVNFNVAEKAPDADSWNEVTSAVSRVNGGIGAGLGLDIWKFQFSAHYDWRFGPWLNRNETSSFANGGAYNGITFTAIFFFN